jgi:two-component system CheB/CheR fusion protein
MRNQKVSDQASSKPENKVKDDFFIVGVGASAGGLEAINELFDNIPEANGFSFVVIQHLSPNYESLMDELLAKHTKLKIIKAEEGKLILPNCIYLIPNKNNMVVRNGHLHLIDKPASSIPNNAINVFFESLAEDRGKQAIGIILSGTGSDGTKGIAAIKDKGGMVIVQDPITAKFDGMPNTAIESGNFDFILPPELMSEEIIRYPELLRKSRKDGQLTFPDGVDAFQKILRLIRENTNYDFTYYKRQTLERRIIKRMTETGIDEMREYALYLLNNREEIEKLADEFLIGVTSFFRDPLAFQVIREQVIPEIISRKRNDDQLKVWVAACSTGEEAYSLAILIHEYMEKVRKELNVKIFATDMDSRAIEFAAKGVYAEQIENDIPRDQLEKYFIHDGQSYIVSRDIRKMVIFAQHNVIKDPPFGQMDMVSCRNMLIYMRAELQKKVMETFHFALNVSGFLFLGSSESSGPIKESLREISKKWNVYQTISKSKAFLFDNQPLENNQFTKKKTNSASSLLPARHSLESKMKEAFHEAITEELGYAAVFISENYDLLQASGDYQKFIHLPERQLRMSLLKLVPKEITLPLTLALRKALSHNEKVSTKRIRLGHEDKRKIWNIVVKPYLSSHEYEQKFLLVIFREEQVEEMPSEDSERFEQQINMDRLAELEEELKETKEDLQLTVEELETSNEELQSLNEELLSSNEELQSTNEELQSLNEELHTVNAEHQIKIRELIELNDDLNNYFSSSQIGQIFVDTNLVIRKYTPTVTEQVNLIESDIGRPINHLSYNIKYDHFLEDIRQVINSRHPIEKELEVSGQTYFLMRIYPYIREDKSVDGAVITFVDITRVKQLNNLLQGVLHSSPNVIMAFEAIYKNDEVVDFSCTMANDAISKILQKDPDEIIGKTLLQTLPGFKKEGLFKRLKRIATAGGVIRQEIHYQQENFHTWLEVLAAPMEKGIALTITDINEKKASESELVQAYEDVKQVEEKLRSLNTELENRVDERTRALSESEHRFRVVAQATNDAVWDLSLVSNDFWWNDTFETIFGYERDKMENGISSLYEHLHPDEAEQVKQSLDEVINQGKKQWSYEHRFRRADGTYAFVFNRAYVLHNEYGIPYRVLGAMIDISKIKEIQEELRQSNENLRHINVDLDNFVYTASHDLKAPIANLESLMGMLKSEPVNETERGKFIINKIDSSISKFKDTLNALAEITKVQQNLDSTNEHLSIQAVLKDVKEDIKKAITESKADIRQNLQVDNIYYPKINLRSILYNLLSNAIKYRHPDRPLLVSVNTYEQDTYIVLEVEDNGLGMNERQQEKLFSMFKRFHSHVKGTGIGLYMVKRMVENKGGHIEVSSEEEKGSIFRVYLRQ